METFYCLVLPPRCLKRLQYNNFTRGASIDFDRCTGAQHLRKYGQLGPFQSFPQALTSLMPLFHLLTRLKTSLSMCTTVQNLEALGYNHDGHIHQILWLVRLNSTTIAHRALEYMYLVDSRTVRHRCRTISKLHRLRALSVSTQCARLFT